MDPVALNLIMIVCFVIGSGLVLLEAFIPGFGVSGISGVVLEVVGLLCIRRLCGTGAALIAMGVVLLLIGIAVTLSYRSAMRGRLSKSHLVLNDTEPAAEKEAADAWLGCEGVTVTALRPEGFIEIGEKRLSAASVGDFIEKGAPVLVTGTEGGRCVVRRKA